MKKSSIAFALCITVAAISACVAEEPQASDDERWKALVFDENQPIHEITIIVYRPTIPSVKDEHAKKFSTSDKMTLLNFAHGLHTAFRAARPSDESLGVIAVDPWGELHVRSGERKEVFVLVRTGFGLGKNDKQVDRFYSWTAAQVVSQLYFRATGSKLDEKLLEGLSTEGIVRAERKRLEALKP